MEDGNLCNLSSCSAAAATNITKYMYKLTRCWLGIEIYIIVLCSLLFLSCMFYSVNKIPLLLQMNTDCNCSRSIHPPSVVVVCCSSVAGSSWWREHDPQLSIPDTVVEGTCTLCSSRPCCCRWSAVDWCQFLTLIPQTNLSFFVDQQ